VRLGSRYPIINATFSPISNSNALTQVLANQSFVAPFPSFTYEDLGLTVKATPQVMADRTVTLKIELQVKSLTGQAINGVPVISNREFTGTMSLMDAQPAMVAGYITKSEQKTLTGIPGIAFIPGLGHATSNRSTEYTDDELLVMITPYIVSPARQGAGNEVWLPAM
jgi:type II secretory pathway component GspD/PulD (secretin)